MHCQKQKNNNHRAIARNKNKTTMKKEIKIAALAAIAAANPNGFTVNAKTLTPVTSGYAVAVRATQNSFGPVGLAAVVDYANTDKEVTAFGGWLDSETGLYYYDAVVITDSFDRAVALAEREGQIAFFSLHEMKEYRIK